MALAQFGGFGGGKILEQIRSRVQQFTKGFGLGLGVLPTTKRAARRSPTRMSPGAARMPSAGRMPGAAPMAGEKIMVPGEKYDFSYTSRRVGMPRETYDFTY